MKKGIDISSSQFAQKYNNHASTNNCAQKSPSIQARITFALSFFVVFSSINSLCEFFLKDETTGIGILLCAVLILPFFILDIVLGLYHGFLFLRKIYFEDLLISIVYMGWLVWGLTIGRVSNWECTSWCYLYLAGRAIVFYFVHRLLFQSYNFIFSILCLIISMSALIFLVITNRPDSLTYDCLLIIICNLFQCLQVFHENRKLKRSRTFDCGKEIGS